jgi:hypothetical protein
MNDRELLELAAKAVGLPVGARPGEWWQTADGTYHEIVHIGESGRHWNPLTDDGDALRLAVKLNLLWKSEVHYSSYIDLSKPNDCENTRRAIVRAAAEIGKAMT